MNFWHFNFRGKEDARLKVMLYNNPHYQISGGPFYNNKHHEKRGKEIVEEIIVQNNNPPGTIGFFIHSAFRVFIGVVEDYARMMREEKMLERKYWGRIMEPYYLEPWKNPP